MGDSSRFRRAVSITPTVSPRGSADGASAKRTQSDFAARTSQSGLARATKLALKGAGMLQLPLGATGATRFMVLPCDCMSWA